MTLLNINSLPQGLPSAKIAWAFHSDCQEELLAMVPGMLRGEPTWKELKAHGVGWWVRSGDMLRRMVDKVSLLGSNDFWFKSFLRIFSIVLLISFYL